jgi:spore coat protein CotH
MHRLRWRRHWKIPAALMAVLVALVVGVGDWRVQAVTSGARLDGRVTFAPTNDISGTVGLFDDGVLHVIEIRYDPTEYDTMIETFQKEDTKEWIRADVVIDGTRIDNVGLRLKGNSSLMSIGGRPMGAGGGFPGGGFPGGQGRPQPGANGGPPRTFGGDGQRPATGDLPALGGAGGGRGGDLGFGPGGGGSVDEPERLPWLLQFDEFVDGQTYDGHSAMVLRSSSTTTGANEALALELVERAGEPIQDSIYTSLVVNGSNPVLRLAIELPDADWDEANFDSAGVLYKALAGGDWSYRGEDPLAYAEAFDQETGKKQQDLAPLLDLLRFLNQSSDPEFEAALAQHLDVESFARYLALQDLLANFDDISGPGNNAYLRYDLDTKTFTVLTWDLNLAFSGGGVPGGAVPAPSAAGSTNPPGGRQVMRIGGNILEDRFRKSERFRSLYDTAYQELRQQLFTSGTAQEILTGIRQFLNGNAIELVDSAAQTGELDRLAQQLASK